MSKRLFVSVDLDGLAAEVEAVQELFEGASGLSFVDPARAHVTLKFLGDTDEDRIPSLIEELETAVEGSGVGPFEATFGGLGVFPSMEYISVVWLGVREAGDRLTALHEAIEDRAVGMGFDPEDHEFTPHVTIARMNHAGGKELVQEAVRECDPDAGTLRVEEVRLTESVLTSEGPEYSTLESFEL
ncbi:RNA 2',3'-cyclic phosphodiesterase [Halapricum desulfuricans]|uniref:RNA 2',3'-cyclic phosphodiesterase n=1 Tax=Halapricum desulfuricans TaxID=2841257 RepID=A0A897N162_9EURY|nr:RNA 2',3'-cyclic phosphodiesterase [Halapricum desulfuricans]QSG06241.1 2'-5' RNA ligase [Halapricum desulfuricans]